MEIDTWLSFLHLQSLHIFSCSVKEKEKKKKQAKAKAKAEVDQEGNGAWDRWCIMGKVEEEQRLSSSVSSEVSVEDSGAPISSLSFRFAACGSKKTPFGLRCFLVLLFSLALFLSALFWLPPFLNFSDKSDLDLNSRFKGSSAFCFPTFFF